jgi:hypothetical protein
VCTVQGVRRGQRRWVAQGGGRREEDVNDDCSTALSVCLLAPRRLSLLLAPRLLSLPARTQDPGPRSRQRQSGARPATMARDLHWR